MVSDVFQSLLWTVYVSLLCVWCVLFGSALRGEYFVWYLLPHVNVLQAPRDMNVERNVVVVYGAILKRYESAVLCPVIRGLLQCRFGLDIATIVMVYFECITLDDEGPVAVASDDKLYG